MRRSHRLRYAERLNIGPSLIVRVGSAVRRHRSEIVARAALTIAALLPYWRFLSLKVLYVTDDVFTSDIFNGELAGRVLVGKIIRSGEFPVWTDQLCSGISLAGAPLDPLGILLFTFLPPAPALDVLVIVLLLVAAHGAYGFARRLGADRLGAVLSGVAFAGSGYIACQLKHLAIISTVVWLPYGLTLIDIAFSGWSPRSGDRPLRAAMMAPPLFGLLFANQVLSGFPQSAYICALVYAAFAGTHAWRLRRTAGTVRVVRPAGAVCIAALLGVAAGAVVLLPLAAVGSISDRAVSPGYDWATMIAYWPPNLVTFVVPYLFGDVSNHTYRGPSIFWEDYGYVGLAPILLAFYGVVRERPRAVVTFVKSMTILGYLFVLGRATPVFHVAYVLLPGLDRFRFPTRFLIVVELGLALLGAIGLSRLRSDVASVKSRSSSAATSIAVAIVLVTVVDLYIHQPRQNPIVSSGEWLSPPASATVILSDSAQPRTYAPRTIEQHEQAFTDARGWADVAPYHRLRELLQPNTGGGYWDLPSADCYAGISPYWYVDVWGDHNRQNALIPSMTSYDPETREVHVQPPLEKLLATFGVTHLLTPSPIPPSPGLTEIRADAALHIYRVEGADRARFVQSARLAGSEQDAVAVMRSPTFDPQAEIVLNKGDFALAPIGNELVHGQAALGRTAIRNTDRREVLIDVVAPLAGYLLLADTFDPGWTADVDGRPAPMYRANISFRAVPVAEGQHTVRFHFEPPRVRIGLALSSISVSALLIWMIGGAYPRRRSCP